MSDGKVIDGSKTVKRAKMHPEESYEKALNVEDEFASTAEFVPPSEFNFSTRTCCFCNGYYGPCFEEPVCPTCHTFLFPNDMDLLQIPIFSEKTDDEDSGNDEPTELYYNYERRTSQQQPQQTSPQSSAANVPNISNLKPHVPRRFTLQHEQTFNVSKIGRNGNDNDVGSGAATSYNKRSYPCSVQSTSNESNEAFLESWKEKNRLAGQFIETRGLRGVVPLQDAKEGDSQCQGNNRIVDRVQETTTSYTLSDRLDMLTICKQEDYEAMSEQGLVEALPPEVLLVVFSHLDDVSLWSAANVCRRWCGLISTHITSQQWQQNVKLRWPLYKPIGSVKNWYKMYDFLASSAPCRTCLSQTCLKSQSPRIQENSWRKNRLHSELKNLRIDPPEGIEATPLDQMCCHWQATITGPVGSPYEGGLFYLYLQVPCSYPLYPPIVRFLTKILHPNVSRHGDVGIDSIHHNWSLALTISKVLISVQSLLTDPYCQVCMEPELGEMYLNDRERFDEIARTWTWQYAMHDVVTPL